MAPQDRIVPALAAARALPFVEDRLAFGEDTLILQRPREPGVLLDLDEVHAHYAADEYLPYWASLWPVARFLAQHLLSVLGPCPGVRTIELGCGLGLVGCAALRRGADVTFTDYDESALEWAARNAAKNAGAAAAFRTLAVDWRRPPAAVFDLVLGSDLIYEQRNAAILPGALRALLAPGGTAYVADQDRPYAADFRAALDAAGLSFTALAVGPDVAIDPEATGTIYRICREV